MSVKEKIKIILIAIVALAYVAAGVICGHKELEGWEDEIPAEVRVREDMLIW